MGKSAFLGQVFGFKGVCSILKFSMEHAVFHLQRYGNLAQYRKLALDISFNLCMLFIS